MYVDLLSGRWEGVCGGGRGGRGGRGGVGRVGGGGGTRRVNETLKRDTSTTRFNETAVRRHDAATSSMPR